MSRNDSNLLDGWLCFEYPESNREEVNVTAVLFKVYCYRGPDKQIWFEVEDLSTGQGIAWSPSRSTAIRKARKLGYTVEGEKRPVLKFYRAKAS